MRKNDNRQSGSLTKDKRGGTNNEKILDKNDIKLMEDRLNAVDEFLILEGDDTLSKSIKECFETWVELFRLREENDRAEIVLSAYYQSEKIRDTLMKLRDFVERMDTVDCDETAREMGYHNYIFFLKRDMNAMSKKYERAVLRQESRQESLACTPDNVAWFIQEECRGIAPVKDLPKVRTDARQMRELAKVGKKPPERFYITAGNISEALDILEPGKKDKDSIADLKKLNELLTERAETLKKNIKEGERLYNTLIERMTDGWFRQFDPEADPIRNMTREQVKDFYNEECRSTLQLLEDEKG